MENVLFVMSGQFSAAFILLPGRELFLDGTKRTSLEVAALAIMLSNFFLMLAGLGILGHLV